jgi:predicted dehydrogenase
MALTRRGFVKGSLAAAAATSALGFPRRVLGANGDIRVAVIGLRGRGWNLIDWAMGVDGVRMAALADADKGVLAEQAQKFGKNYGSKNGKIDTYQDFRAVIERKDIDAVIVATPNHWHSLMGIMAMEAGKDLYCEKPVSHNVWEGRQLVNAARKYNRIAQTGTQSRSSRDGIATAVDFVRSGQLGKIQYIVGTCYKPRKSVSKLDKPLNIHPNIDYDLWCGPAEKRDIFRKSLHYDWHWDFNTGNGDLGNQGIHQMDIARWFLGAKQLSPRVLAVGGRFGYSDASDTPNTELVIHAYDEAPLYFDTRGLPRSSEYKNDKWNQMMDDYHGVRIGVVVQCEGGRMLVPSYSSAKAVDNNGKTIKPFNGAVDHMANFIDAMRSRKREQLHAEIEEGHISSGLCHTGNISYRLGAGADPNAMKDAFKAQAGANEVLGRFIEHCKANEVNIDKKEIVLGQWLEMDPKTERFTNSEAANAMLTRQYRKPFVVPDVKIA